MRLTKPLKTSKGVAIVKEITPLDYVLALTLAIQQYGDVYSDDVDNSFWLERWLDQGLIELDGEFTETEFAEIVNQFELLNEPPKHSNTASISTPTVKRLSRVIADIKTDCAVLIGQYNHQQAFGYGFNFIRHLQQLYSKK